MIAKGRTVTLRDLRRSDVDEMCRWQKYTEPQFQWANFNARSELDKDVWFSMGQSSSSRRFAIIDGGEQAIGVVGLRDINPHKGEATLGIRMNAGEVSRGYGTDAIVTLMDYAFSKMGLQRVNLDVAEDNPRARRCYEKCGFAFVGRRVSYDGIVYIDMTLNKGDFYRRHPRFMDTQAKNSQA
jgi:diamine N-acetyltransferase